MLRIRATHSPQFHVEFHFHVANRRDSASKTDSDSDMLHPLRAHRHGVGCGPAFPTSFWTAVVVDLLGLDHTCGITECPVGQGGLLGVALSASVRWTGILLGNHPARSDALKRIIDGHYKEHVAKEASHKDNQLQDG